MLCPWLTQTMLRFRFPIGTAYVVDSLCLSDLVIDIFSVVEKGFYRWACYER